MKRLLITFLFFASASCSGDLADPTFEDVRISLTRTALTMTVGEWQTLHLEVDPVPASALDIHWSSSDPDIASVDSAGTVTANSPGETTVIAAVGKRFDACTVKVTKTRD